MKKIPVSMIKDFGTSKPAGYVEACMSSGSVVDGVLHLTEAAFSSIRKRFAKAGPGHPPAPFHCEFRVRSRESNRMTCEIGLYGGLPCSCDCRKCVASGQNNREFAKKIFDSFEKSHPPSAPRASGCCDSAENHNLT